MLRFVYSLIFLALLQPLSAQAEITVAFIEARWPDGKLVQLEQHGRFYHVAISYKGGWLHAYPTKGVERIEAHELSKVGYVAEYITLKGSPDLTEAQVQKFLGKPFDRTYSWEDGSYYCSELIAKILGLEPKPMDFPKDTWPESYWKYQGRPGISPDDVYQQLMSQGYDPHLHQTQCSNLLES